MTKQRNQSQA